MSFDLSKLDTSEAAAKGAKLELRHPNTGEVLRHDDGRPFTITLVGRDSEKFMSLARAQSDRRLQQTLRSRQPALTAAVEKDDTELLVNATLEWDIIFDGKPAENSAKAYREVYSNPGYRWLREQVDEFIGNRANFSTG